MKKQPFYAKVRVGDSESFEWKKVNGYVFHTDFNLDIGIRKEKGYAFNKKKSDYWVATDLLTSDWMSCATTFLVCKACVKDLLSLFSSSPENKEYHKNRYEERYLNTKDSDKPPAILHEFCGKL
jgi:hypothetical protein